MQHDGGATRRLVDEAVRLLAGEGPDGGAESEVEVLRASMDEAVKLMDKGLESGPHELPRKIRQAMAILVRGEGAETTRAEAGEETARALEGRIGRAVEALQDVHATATTAGHEQGALAPDRRWGRRPGQRSGGGEGMTLFNRPARTRNASYGGTASGAPAGHQHLPGRGVLHRAMLVW